MNAFTIKDLENLSGIKAHTIRIWEQRYNFLKPQRTDTNIRYYSDHELKMLLNIALLNKHGFKISHIDKMSEVEVNDKIASLNDPEALHERLLIQMIESMVNLDIHSFEKLIDHQFQKKGMEKTIQQLIFPFLEKIGILWQTDKINPAQEHLVTHLIRQKLILGIDAAKNNLFSTSKTALLFLPDAEYHELGLLFVHFIMKSRGIQVVYLGCNVPAQDVIFVMERIKPDLLYTHLTCIPSVKKMEQYIQNIVRAAKEAQFIISGSAVHQTSIPKWNGVRIIHKMSDAIALINSISVSGSTEN